VELLALHEFFGRAAENGREGLRLLRVRLKLPKLILLDLNMPVLDGWGFLLERRKDSRLLTVPVIVISASTGIEDMSSAGSVMQKPVEPNHLLSVMELILKAA
jgi:DNA-binding response OmpR family regulator